MVLKFCLLLNRLLLQHKIIDLDWGGGGSNASQSPHSPLLNSHSEICV